jgi:outer membrane protein assembly factor BamB
MTFGPDGNLYVSEGNPPAGGTNSDPQVLRYDGSTGVFIDPFTPVFAEPIRTIVFGPDGDLYGNTGGTVFKADGTTGAFIDTFVDLGLGEATSGLTFGPDGNLYVSSYLANQVLRFDATTGSPIGLDGVFAEVPISGAAGHPAGLTFGPDGDLYVALRDGADVWRFDGATGDSLGSFIPAADVHPDVPSSPIFGPDGNLYVASQGSDQVLRYDGTSGGFIDVFTSGGDLDEPVALVFVPEPGQLVLVATGALLLAAVGRRRAP